MKNMLFSVLILAICFLAAASSAETPVFPPDPAWHEYKITGSDAVSARKAGKDVLAYLFGDLARNVSRFNRLDPRQAQPGRTVKVPEMPSGVLYTPMPAYWPEAAAYPKYVLIALDLQFLGAYEYGRLVASYPIASGKNGHETPAGDFQIRIKEPFIRSTKYPEPYGGAPMPFAEQFSRGGYWLHAGNLPGQRASHGCVRMMLADAKALYGWTEIGIPVKVMKTLR